MYWAKDRPFARCVLGERSDCHKGVFWAKERPVTLCVLGEGYVFRKVCIGRTIGLSQRVLGEGSACHKVCTGQRIGLLQYLVCQGLLGEGSAFHKDFTGRRIGLSRRLHGRIRKEKTRRCTWRPVGLVTACRCKELCATI